MSKSMELPPILTADNPASSTSQSNLLAQNNNNNNITNQPLQQQQNSSNNNSNNNKNVNRTIPTSPTSSSSVQNMTVQEVRKKRIESTDETVEAQAALHNKAKDSIWNAVLKNDIERVRALVETDPSVLEQRGPVGEIPLHMAFVYQHNDLAKFMVEISPKHLITAVYEGTQYHGENILHIAIVNQNAELVRFLVEKEPSLMLGRADGKFFSMGEACYYGEYPFMFAACTNRKDIVDILMDAGADVTATDKHGNNVLHLMVIHGLKDMFDYLEVETARRLAAKDEIKHADYQTTVPTCPLLQQSNKQKRSPFTLSARLGKKDMFFHLLEKRKQVQWSYGPVTSAIYPLEDLDHVAGRTERKGALAEIIDHSHVDLLVHPKLVGLLKKKWKRFARTAFLKRFFLTVFFMCIFTVAVVLQPSSDESASGVINHVCELLVVILCFLKFLREMSEMYSSGFLAYFQVDGAGFLENTGGTMGCVMVFIAFFIRMGQGDAGLENLFISFAALCFWAYLMFFALGFTFTGPFVVMIYKMIIGDVTRFIVIFFIFLMGFSQATYLVLDTENFADYRDRLQVSFAALLGSWNFEDFTSGEYYHAAQVYLIIYVFLGSILLVNLLIAMMADTYEQVKSEAEKQWLLEWTRIIFSIENELSVKERNSNECNYWIELDNKRYVQVEEVEDNYFTRKNPWSQQIYHLDNINNDNDNKLNDNGGNDGINIVDFMDSQNKQQQQQQQFLPEQQIEETKLDDFLSNNIVTSTTTTTANVSAAATTTLVANDVVQTNLLRTILIQLRDMKQQLNRVQQNNRQQDQNIQFLSDL